MLQIKRELTPETLQCGPVLGCPAIYELMDGQLLIVGKSVLPDDLPPDVRRRIAADEISVVVTRELLGGAST